MDPRRESLQAMLETTLGSSEVFFQPPANVSMTYPAIVYSRDRSETQFAGNRPYHRETRYQVTLIARDPDISKFGELADLPQCLHVRSFAADNLHHDVFSIVF